jgi:hydrogenase maturation protease
VIPVGEEAGAEKPPEANVAVLGLGNVLMGDDALGPTVVKVLEAEYEFPPGVSVQDLGTPGLDLTPYLAGVTALIVVDTVHSRGAPGEMRLYRRDEILKNPPQPRLSPHDPGLKEALLTVEFSGSGPREVLLIGVIPGEVRTGVGLNPAVRAAVPLAVAEVVNELARLGVAPSARTVPGTPDLWWERP